MRIYLPLYPDKHFSVFAWSSLTERTTLTGIQIKTIQLIDPQVNSCILKNYALQWLKK